MWTTVITFTFLSYTIAILSAYLYVLTNRLYVAEIIERGIQMNTLNRYVPRRKPTQKYSLYRDIKCPTKPIPQPLFATVSTSTTKANVSGWLESKSSIAIQTLQPLKPSETSIKEPRTAPTEIGDDASPVKSTISFEDTPKKIGSDISKPPSASRLPVPIPSAGSPRSPSSGTPRLGVSPGGSGPRESYSKLTSGESRTSESPTAEVSGSRGSVSSSPSGPSSPGSTQSEVSTGSRTPDSAGASDSLRSSPGSPESAVSEIPGSAETSLSTPGSSVSSGSPKAATSGSLGSATSGALVPGTSGSLKPPGSGTSGPPGSPKPPPA